MAALKCRGEADGVSPGQLSIFLGGIDENRFNVDEARTVMKSVILHLHGGPC